MSNEEKNSFKRTVESLFNGMDSFLTTKTVVGEPIQIGDTIILPLVDVAFGVAAGAFDKNNDATSNAGGGGMGGKLTPGAVLVINNGVTRLVNVKNSNGLDKILDMVPDFLDKFANGKFKGAKKDSDDYNNPSRNEAKKALEETVIAASKVEED